MWLARHFSCRCRLHGVSICWSILSSLMMMAVIAAMPCQAENPASILHALWASQCGCTLHVSPPLLQLVCGVLWAVSEPPLCAAVDFSRQLLLLLAGCLAAVPLVSEPP